MRNCPVCNSNNFEVLWRSTFLVPDGFTQPNYLDWKRCECGMIYGDNETITQKDYDTYYIERYGYGVIGLESTNTLMERGKYIVDTFDKKSVVVDFGGGESGLPEYLRENGFNNVALVGCGSEMPPTADVIIAHHVLEHVYDMNEVMEKITNSLWKDGALIVDVPDAGRMALENTEKFPMMDYTQVHINHFRLFDMLNLARRWGFELVETQSYHARFGTARMYVFIKNKNIVGEFVKHHVLENVSYKLAELAKLGKEEVCVWGFGDIASHCLSQVWPNVKYFVNSDPAFVGATIKGLPVYTKPIDDLPIVVIAQAQRQSLLQYIKSLGIKNRIIEI